MKNYPALNAITSMIKVFAISTGILGTIGLIIMVQNYTFEKNTFLYAVFSLMGIVAIFLILWACAEIILVFVNISEDVSKIVTQNNIEETIHISNEEKEIEKANIDDIEDGEINKVCSNCIYLSKDNSVFYCLKQVEPENELYCSVFVRKPNN